MATPAVGEDIEALCGRCGQVWHVVMAKMGDKIAKVVCKRCNGHHLYRTEQMVADRANGEPPPRAPAGRRPRPRATPAAVPVVPTYDPSKPPIPYAATQSYATGERVVHSTFGTGVVVGSPGPGKAEVAFPIGRRILASAKTASTLERPSLAQHVPVADRPPDKL